MPHPNRAKLQFEHELLKQLTASSHPTKEICFRVTYVFMVKYTKKLNFRLLETPNCLRQKRKNRLYPSQTVHWTQRTSTPIPIHDSIKSVSCQQRILHCFISTNKRSNRKTLNGLRQKRKNSLYPNQPVHWTQRSSTPIPIHDIIKENEPSTSQHSNTRVGF